MFVLTASYSGSRVPTDVVRLCVSRQVAAARAKTAICRYVAGCEVELADTPGVGDLRAAWEDTDCGDLIEAWNGMDMGLWFSVVEDHGLSDLESPEFPCGEG
jgi:hypothetical protein